MAKKSKLWKLVAGLEVNLAEQHKRLETNIDDLQDGYGILFDYHMWLNKTFIDDGGKGGVFTHLDNRWKDAVSHLENYEIVLEKAKRILDNLNDAVEDIVDEGQDIEIAYS